MIQKNIISKHKYVTLKRMSKSQFDEHHYWCTFSRSYPALRTFWLLLGKKIRCKSIGFFYPSRRPGIDARRLAIPSLRSLYRRAKRGVYHQGRRDALVSHHAPACIFLRLDAIHHFVMIPYGTSCQFHTKPTAWIKPPEWAVLSRRHDEVVCKA